MTHEEIKILISAYADGEVTPSERTIVEEHLKECASCRKDLSIYKAMSSSLSKWPDETLSPDETIKVQKRFEQRKGPIFTQRTMLALGTTLALSIIIGSVVQQYANRGAQERLKSTTYTIGEQLSDKTVSRNIPQIAEYPAGLKSYASGKIFYAAASFAPENGLASDLSAPDSASFAIRQKDAVNYHKNALITLIVPDPRKTQSILADLITKFNGVIISAQIKKSNNGTTNGSVVFKILPKDIEKALPEIRKLGINAQQTAIKIYETQSDMSTVTVVFEEKNKQI